MKKEEEKQEEEKEEQHSSSRRSSSSSSSSSSSRVYLQALIKIHPIWREPRFWEQAIHEAYAREIERCPKAKLTHRWCTDDEQAEAAELQSKILFGILMSYQHNMRGFGVDAETTTRIIVQLCASFNMSGEQTQTLVTLAKSALPASPK